MDEENIVNQNIDQDSQDSMKEQQLYQKHQFQPFNTHHRNELQNHNKINARQQQQQNPSNDKTDHSDQMSETNDQQVAGFTIIGQDATNQVLQINLYPKERIFVRGKILYANFDYRDKTHYVGYQTFSQFLKQLVHTGFHPMRKIHNVKSHIVYAGISKGGGKILTIDSQVYGKDIFINPGKVILSNVYHENSKIKKHPNLKRFQNRLKLNEKNGEMRSLVVLQSSNNNVIVEKYLGVKQKLYVEERLIVGLSGTVKCESGFGGFGSAKLRGPGWVFMENDSNSWIRENKLMILGMGLILFWIVSSIIGINRT